MGTKGDKLTQDSVLVAKSMVEKLNPIGDISTKKMFGGHGVFHNGKMFGIVDSKGQAFLKADETNKKDFEEKGAQKHGKMPYYSIPKEIMDRPEALVAWARKSIKVSK